VFSESTVESVALFWFERLNYTVIHDPDIVVDEPGAERR